MDYTQIKYTSSLFSQTYEVSFLSNLTVRDVMSETIKEFGFEQNNYGLYLRRGDSRLFLDPGQTLMEHGIRDGMVLAFEKRRDYPPLGVILLAQTAYLIEEKTRAVFFIEWQPAYIGRSEPNNNATAEYLAVDLRPVSGDDRRISRQQAQITQSHGKLCLSSLKNQNPVNLNGEAIEVGIQSPLNEGDSIQIGSVCLSFSYQKP